MKTCLQCKRLDSDGGLWAGDAELRCIAKDGYVNGHWSCDAASLGNLRKHLLRDRSDCEDFEEIAHDQCPICHTVPEEILTVHPPRFRCCGESWKLRR